LRQIRRGAKKEKRGIPASAIGAAAEIETDTKSEEVIEMSTEDIISRLVTTIGKEIDISMKQNVQSGPQTPKMTMPKTMSSRKPWITRTTTRPSTSSWRRLQRRV
jgi:hypothetical protein